MAEAPPTVLRDITDRLLDKFGDELPAAVVEERVRSIYEQLSTNARITTYVPVLAERAAEARLAALLATNRPDADSA